MGEEQRMILEMVRQRTITPEEAVQLLQALAPFAGEPEEDGEPEDGRKRMRRGEGGRPDAAPPGDTEKRAKKEEQKEDNYESRESDGDGKWFSRWGSLSARVSEVFEAAMEKVRGIDFELGDFQWGHSRTVEEVFAGEMDGKHLSVILPHGSVILTGWEDPGYRIEVKGFIKEDAEGEALRQLRKNVHFRKGERMVLELEKQRRYRVEVRACVPRAWLDELTVVAYNGFVHLNNLDVDKIVLYSHNGPINIHQVVGQQLEATTGNGKLEIADGHFQHASLLSVNGHMEVSGILGDATCRAVNGQMNVQLREPSAGQLFLKTTNGSIRIGLPENVSVQGEFTGAFGKVNNTLMNVEVLAEVKEWLNYTYLFRTFGVDACQVRLTGNCINGSVSLQRLPTGSRGE